MKLLRSSPAAERIGETSSETVHVAVGRSPEKTLRLLEWTFQRFQCREIVLVHIHRPSSTIPTLLGNLPADQANEKLVSAYRLEERRNTEKLLLRYFSICYRSQVQAKVILVEAEYIQKGIVDVVKKHAIRKLVMGASPDRCFKVKSVFSKAIYITKSAPFCEIWFVHKGKFVWVREAIDLNETLSSETIKIKSSQNQSTVPMRDTKYDRSASFSTKELENHGEGSLSQFYSAGETDLLADSDISPSVFSVDSENKSLVASKTTLFTSRCEKTSPTKANPKGDPELENFSRNLKEIIAETENAEKDVYADLSKRKEIECAVTKTLSMVKSSEASQLREVKIREELEELIVVTKLKQNELVNQIEKSMKELQSTMENVAILDVRVREMFHRKDKATVELDSTMSSIAALKLENQKIQHQRDEYVQQIERLRCNHRRKSKICNKFIGLGSDSLDFKEFPLSDLQTATFGFSDAFMIGQGGLGCVYKGEMLNRSVAIKKFHHHSIQGQREFQQEVFVLSKLRHPNLVTLIGACPEALSLVYEYFPNGNLHDRIICKTMSPPLAWMTRVRIIAEISCALLFLHSSKPEKVVHGDLKPMNIFLDSNLSCRISGFGFCELLLDQVAAGYPLLRQTSVPKNPCSEFPYSDPEYQRTGILTSKSDVYSFGIIVLQLLTGRPPLGLATEVRRAVLSHRLSDLLDLTAGEWPINVSERLAEFGLKCTELCGRNRPELTPAVVRELELLHSKRERTVPTSFVCPIFQEIMYDPVAAADGFTYERTAILEWLDNGRATSPMTNLELENLNLFPNHALKLAIQDWLCQAFQD
ncbi:U-box domain-containing protein 33 [Dendrobium catenatum]|uniref:U-box domain-containing protein 33 n=1 Tax=Dendrobium catenatum TaxID=906689 RepID=UPI0009F65A95|nr:U-box domain-containing protein 33 [Dendrobium catenatum]